MKAGLKWWVAAASVLVAMAGVRGASAAPADFLKIAPADHEALIYADVTQVRTSKLYQDLKPQIINAQLEAGLSFIQQLTGMKLPDDIDAVAVSGRISNQQNGCIYVRGRLNRTQIESIFAQNPGYTEIPKEGGKIIGFLDENKGTMAYLTFLSNDLAVIGQKEAVEGAFATYNKKGRSMADNAAIQAQVAGAAPNPILLAVAVRPKTPPPQIANTPVLQDAKSAFVSLVGSSNTLTLTVRLEAQTAPMAAQWLKVVEGVIALGQIQQKVPKLNDVAKQATARQQGAIVEATARVRTDDLKQFAQQRIAASREQVRNAGPAEPHPEKAATPQW
jgi:hypothetical protein